MTLASSLSILLPSIPQFHFIVLVNTCSAVLNLSGVSRQSSFSLDCQMEYLQYFGAEL